MYFGVGKTGVGLACGIFWEWVGMVCGGQEYDGCRWAIRDRVGWMGGKAELLLGLGS